MNILRMLNIGLMEEAHQYLLIVIQFDPNNVGLRKEFSSCEENPLGMGLIVIIPLRVSANRVVKLLPIL